MRFKKIFSTILSSVLVFSMTTSTYADKLTFPIVTQGDYGSACWAASGAATCQYYGIGISMFQFANTCGRVLTLNDSNGDPTSSGEAMTTIQYGLACYGIATTFYPQDSNFAINTTYPKLQAEIDVGDPIVADVYAHAVVIRGYSGVTLSIMDPAFNYYTSVIHSNFYSASNNTYGYKFNSALFT